MDVGGLVERVARVKVCGVILEMWVWKRGFQGADCTRFMVEVLVEVLVRILCSLVKQMCGGPMRGCISVISCEHCKSE